LDSQLGVPALTPADLDALAFAAKHADVEMLEQHLDSLQADPLGIVLKIETRRGFNNLAWTLAVKGQSFRARY
jgi:pyruvate kinase